MTGLLLGNRRRILMPRPLRRARGALLRVVLQRRVSMALGAALLVLPLVLWIGDFRWENGITDGLSLIAAATGAALVLAGLGGRRGDWVEPDR
jgi:hypothetical protein